ncbi:MAG: GTPase [Halanaerobiales bacterium]
MPANLTPEYYEAEKAFKSASTIEEKIAALNEMLAVIPKHKGTDKLRADLRKKLSNLKEEKGKSKGGEKQDDPYLVEKQGAGQVLLIGFPNTGKSSFVERVTNAKVEVASYPYTTSLPQPAMMPYENIKIQLVDSPPLTEDGIPGPFLNTIRRADLLLLFIDLSRENCIDQLQMSLEFLKEKRLLRAEKIPEVQSFTKNECPVIANKYEVEGSKERLEIIKELLPDTPDIIPVSVKTGENIDKLKEIIFQRLNIIRIYTKAPGKKADTENPFVLTRGSTIMDFAQKVHRDIAKNLKKARVWGSARFDGQSVSQDYVLEDQDIVELHD